MYQSQGEERWNEFKALGTLLGAKFKDDKDTIPKASDPNVDSSFEFLDPKDYEQMTEAERKDLTDKMMGRHKMWASRKSPLGDEDAS